MTRSRIFTTSLTVSSVLLCAAVACTLPGCGERGALGGGARSEVSVTIIPTADAGGGGAGGSEVAAAGYGHLKGKVTITGTAPSLGPLVTASQVKPDDKSVCVVERIPNERLVVHNGAVQNVFLYLSKRPAGAKLPEPAPAAVVMDHDTCTFKPHALVVLTGQPINVLNADGVPHNVHTYPQRSGSFNSGIPPLDRKGFDFKYVNAERQPVSVKCDFHTWMQAWHLPLDHPYGAVTNENGEFSIRDLPAGKHKFTVWHEGNTLREVEVTIEPDGEAELNLEIPAGEFKVSAAGGAPQSVVLSMAR